MVTAQIRITQMPSMKEKLKIQIALRKFSWVSRVRFEVPFDEPEIQVDHRRGDMGYDTHNAMKDLVARIEETVPGLVVNG